LLIDKIEKQQFKPLKVPEAGVYCLADGRKLRVSRRVVDGDFVVERSNNVASLDAAKVEFPLVLRLWEHGDRLVPFGMRGTKLVSDLLTDSKMPLPARQRQLVLADGSGRVVWVVGLRSDNRFRIAPDTRQALVVTIEQG
jgi:tRNA(Ile)-lysidine synthase